MCSNLAESWARATGESAFFSLSCVANNLDWGILARKGTLGQSKRYTLKRQHFMRSNSKQVRLQPPPYSSLPPRQHARSSAELDENESGRGTGASSLKEEAQEQDGLLG